MSERSSMPEFPARELLAGRPYYIDGLEDGRHACLLVDGVPIDIGIPGDWFAYKYDIGYSIVDGMTGCPIAAPADSIESAIEAARAAVKTRGSDYYYQRIATSLIQFGSSMRWQDGGPLQRFIDSFVASNYTVAKIVEFRIPEDPRNVQA